MIITLKNLQQQTFVVQFDPKKTVLELKERIFVERGSIYNVEKQKLIYAGVILDDSRSVESYNIDKNKFVVVMMTRELNTKPNKSLTQNNKEPVEDKCEENTSTKLNEESQLLHSQPEKKTLSNETHDKDNEDKQRVDTGTSGNGAAVQLHDASNSLTRDDYNRSIDLIIEMGYTREMVERAMAASFNNSERAVEYLINGIPQLELSDLELPPSSDNLNHAYEHRDSNITGIFNRDASEIGVGASNAESIQDTENTINEDPFLFLRNQPQFEQMRSLVYQNPELLHAVLQQIGQTNPALLQLISQNQDAFLSMLNRSQELSQHSGSHHNRSNNLRSSLNSINREEAYQNSSRTNDLNIQGANNDVNRSSSQSTISRTLTGTLTNENETPVRLRLTQQDEQAIERLKSMGFPESLVMQAYFACERNEQLAANFLISSSEDYI